MSRPGNDILQHSDVGTFAPDAVMPVRMRDPGGIEMKRIGKTRLRKLKYSLIQHKSNLREWMKSLKKRLSIPGGNRKSQIELKPLNGSEFRTLLTRTESAVAGSVKTPRTIPE